MNKLKYLWQTLRHFKEMGTVIPSSETMCRQMTGFIEPSQDKVIVELGAGNGVITRHILAKMAPDALLFVFEDAQSMSEHLQKYNYSEADHIISAIPFLILPEDLRLGILKASHQVLKNQGLFVQLHYSKGIIDLYKHIFGSVETKYVAANFPPGYVFKCINKKDILTED